MSLISISKNFVEICEQLSCKKNSETFHLIMFKLYLQELTKKEKILITKTLTGSSVEAQQLKKCQIDKKLVAAIIAFLSTEKQLKKDIDDFVDKFKLSSKDSKEYISAGLRIILQKKQISFLRKNIIYLYELNTKGIADNEFVGLRKKAFQEMQVALYDFLFYNYAGQIKDVRLWQYKILAKKQLINKKNKELVNMVASLDELKREHRQKFDNYLYLQEKLQNMQTELLSVSQVIQDLRVNSRLCGIDFTNKSRKITELNDNIAIQEKQIDNTEDLLQYMYSQDAILHNEISLLMLQKDRQTIYVQDLRVKLDVALLKFNRLLTELYKYGNFVDKYAADTCNVSKQHTKDKVLQELKEKLSGFSLEVTRHRDDKDRLLHEVNIQQQLLKDMEKNYNSKYHEQCNLNDSIAIAKQELFNLKSSHYCLLRDKASQQQLLEDIKNNNFVVEAKVKNAVDLEIKLQDSIANMQQEYFKAEKRLNFLDKKTKEVSEGIDLYKQELHVMDEEKTRLEKKIYSIELDSFSQSKVNMLDNYLPDTKQYVHDRKNSSFMSFYYYTIEQDYLNVCRKIDEEINKYKKSINY